MSDDRSARRMRELIAYLEAEAAKSADPLPPAREVFDIPAFLRRMAD